MLGGSRPRRSIREIKKHNCFSADFGPGPRHRATSKASGQAQGTGPCPRHRARPKASGQAQGTGPGPRLRARPKAPDPGFVLWQCSTRGSTMPGSTQPCADLFFIRPGISGACGRVSRSGPCTGDMTDAPPPARIRCPPSALAVGTPRKKKTNRARAVQPWCMPHVSVQHGPVGRLLRDVWHRPEAA